jgi:transposase
MKRSRFSEAQIAFVLRQSEEGVRVEEVCRKAGISQATFYAWKKKYGGLMPSEMRRLRQLEGIGDLPDRPAAGREKPHRLLPERVFDHPPLVRRLLAHQCSPDSPVRSEKPSTFSGEVQASKERCRRRRSHLRGGDTAEHAVRARQVSRAAVNVRRTSHAQSSDRPAHAAHQCSEGSPRRARHRCRAGPRWLREAHRRHSQGRGLPVAMLRAMRTMVAGLAALQTQIAELDRSIHDQHRTSDVSRRLKTVPSIGLLGATALTATITVPSAFKSGRDLAAWIGLVPKQNSTGGKERLGGISKLGDRYLRRLLVARATAVVRHARRHREIYPWIAKLRARKPAKVVAIAVTNKSGRIAWAIMTRGGTYRSPALAAAA